MDQNKKSKRMRNLVVGAFLTTPILASLISALHLIDFFDLGNNSWMSYVLAITFELGSIASFVSLGVLKKVKKWAVISIFIILLFMQLAGNIYYVFDYVNQKLAQDPNWLNTFIEMVRPIYDSDNASDYKFVLAMLIGITIPLVSILFLKSLVDYLSIESEEAQQIEEVKSVKVVEIDESEIDAAVEALETTRTEVIEPVIEQVIEPVIEPVIEKIIEPIQEVISIEPIKNDVPTMPSDDDFDASLYQNNN